MQLYEMHGAGRVKKISDNIAKEGIPKVKNFVLRHCKKQKIEFVKSHGIWLTVLFEHIFLLF